MTDGDLLRALQLVAGDKKRQALRQKHGDRSQDQELHQMMDGVKALEVIHLVIFGEEDPLVPQAVHGVVLQGGTMEETGLEEEHVSNVERKDTCLGSVQREDMAVEEEAVEHASNVEKKVTCRENVQKEDLAVEEEAVEHASNVEKKVICRENVRKEVQEVVVEIEPALNVERKVISLDIVLREARDQKGEVAEHVLNVEKKDICLENVLKEAQAEEVLVKELALIVVKRAICQENALILKIIIFLLVQKDVLIVKKKVIQQEIAQKRNKKILVVDVAGTMPKIVVAGILSPKNQIVAGTQSLVILIKEVGMQREVMLVDGMKRLLIRKKKVDGMQRHQKR